MEITVKAYFNDDDPGGVDELRDLFVQNGVPAEVRPHGDDKAAGVAAGAAVGMVVLPGIGTILGPLIGSLRYGMSMHTSGLSDMVIKVGIPAVTAVASSLATWLARSGRKVVMQIRDGEKEFKIEAETPEQARQLIDMAKDYQQKLSARNASAGE